MTAPAKPTIIGPDLIVKGDIRNGGVIEVRGYIEGSVAADHLVVHDGGRVFGTVRANAADVNGKVQGTVAVKNLVNIGATGTVAGDVRYGKLALATGGNLEASVRNVPPELAGDFEIAVRRGRTSNNWSKRTSAKRRRASELAEASMARPLSVSSAGPSSMLVSSDSFKTGKCRSNSSARTA